MAKARVRKTLFGGSTPLAASNGSVALSAAKGGRVELRWRKGGVEASRPLQSQLALRSSMGVLLPS